MSLFASSFLGLLASLRQPMRDVVDSALAGDVLSIGVIAAVIGFAVYGLLRVIRFHACRSGQANVKPVIRRPVDRAKLKQQADAARARLLAAFRERIKAKVNTADGGVKPIPPFIDCPHCKSSVKPTENGICPSCGCQTS